MIIVTRASPTHGIFPVAVLSEAVQHSLKGVNTLVLDHFQNEKALWLRVKGSTPQMPESASVRRLAEIERDRKLFGDGTPSVLIEGHTAEDIAIKCLIGERFLTVTFKRQLEPEEKRRAGEVIPKIKSIIQEIHPEVKFDDTSV